MCPIMDQQTETEKQANSPKRVEIQKSSRIIVSLGLNREKQWTRDQVKTLRGLLNQNFSELKNELKDGKEVMESTLEMINVTIDDKIQTKLSKLDEVITNNVKEMHEVSLKSDSTEQLISTQQKEIETLKETQAKLVNVLISANLINLDNLINFEHLGNYDFTCPSDWTKYSSYCYLYVEQMKTFSEARAHCKRLGAIVSDIENKAEISFIERLIRGWVWIGYIDEKKEGTWVSKRTGQPASFTKFNTGELNGGTGANCLITDGNAWYDFPCHRTRTFICKKDAKIDLKL